MATRHPFRIQAQNRQRITILIFVILAIVLAVAVVTIPSGSSVPTVGALAGREASAAIPLVEIDWEAPDAYEPRWPDPTRLVYSSKRKAVVTQDPNAVLSNPIVAPPPLLDIRGVVFSEEEPLVIVGTEVLHEGQSAGPIQIVKIRLDGVDLKSGDKTWTQSFTE